MQFKTWNISFVFLMILLISLVSSFSIPSVQDSDLNSYYNLEELSGSVIDVTGNGYNLTNYGATTNITGKHNKAYSFNGTNDYLHTNSFIQLSTSTDVSVSYWVYFDTIKSQSILGVGSDASNEFLIRVRMNSSGYLIYETLDDTDGSSIRSITTPSVYSTGQWYNIVITYNGSNNEMKFYVNNSFIGSNTAIANGNNGTNLFIGQAIYNGGGDSSYFSGRIDEFGVWKKILNSSQIDYLYNSGAGNFYSFTAENPIQSTPINNSLFLRNESVNFTANISTSDSLKNITLIIDGIDNETQNITGSSNFTYFLKSFNTVKNYTWAYRLCNASNECILSDEKNLIIRDFEIISVDYPLTSLNNEEITIYSVINISSGSSLSNAKLYYDGSEYTTTITQISGNLYNISRTLIFSSSGENKTFHFIYNTSTGDSGLSKDYIIQPNLVNIDNCSSYGNSLLNLSLFDEKQIKSLNGMIEISLEFKNNDNGNTIKSYNNSKNNTNFLRVCSLENLSNYDIYVDGIITYYSGSKYVKEFYHLQSLDIKQLPSLINLYLLNKSQATKFGIIYYDSGFSIVPSALIQIQRYYTGENVYRTVEIPITSGDGTAVGYFDLNNYKYKISVTKSGSLLDTFDDITLTCENEFLGDCSIVLRDPSSDVNTPPIETEVDFSYNIYTVDDTFYLSFSTPSGNSRDVRLYVEQRDRFSQKELCNSSVYASSSTISCLINKTVGDSEIKYKIYLDNGLIASSSFIYSEDLSDFYALNNFFLASIIFISVTLMFISSPAVSVIISMITLLFLGFVFLIKGMSLTLISTSLIWLLIAGIILLIKITKREEGQ